MWGYLAWKAGMAVFWTTSMKSPGQSWKSRVTGFVVWEADVSVEDWAPQEARMGAARVVPSNARRVSISCPPLGALTPLWSPLSRAAKEGGRISSGLRPHPPGGWPPGPQLRRRQHLLQKPQIVGAGEGVDLRVGEAAVREAVDEGF